VSSTISHGGIPSPAAGKLLTRAAGGGAATTATAPDGAPLVFAGIPSPAAAAKLAPQTLPYRPSDGVTLPRMSIERDGHAADTHYGADRPLAPGTPAARPALTPGEAAHQSEQRAAGIDLSGTDISAY
jgi:hypothetical protein